MDQLPLSAMQFKNTPSHYKRFDSSKGITYGFKIRCLFLGLIALSVATDVVTYLTDKLRDVSLIK